MKRSPLNRMSAKARQRAQHLARARADVKVRSRGLCEALYSTECRFMGDQAHHIKRRSQGGTDDLANLLWVCVACHHAIHANPADAAAHGLLDRRAAE